MKQDTLPNDAKPARRAWWKQLLRDENAPPRYSLREIMAVQRRHWRNPMAWLYAALLCVCIGIFLWQASIYWVAVIDDAYITFRFSDNFIHGYGLRFNPHGMRVEGYTNFLWMVLMGLAIGLGFDVMFIAKLLGLGCSIATIVVAFVFTRNLRRRDDLINVLPSLFLAVNSHFAHWSLMGLETPMAVFLVFYTYYRFHKEMHDHRAWLISPFIASMAAMTRIDSLYYLSPLGLYGVVLILSKQLSLRRLILWGFIAAVTFGGYFGWRLNYFGDMAPNTYYAKQRLVSDVDRTRGMAHIVEYYLDHNGGESALTKPPVVPGKNISLDQALWWMRGGRANPVWWLTWWLASVLIIVSFPTLQNLLLIAAPLYMNLLYVYHVDGDWMPNFRFFQVIAPFLAIAGPVAIGVIQDVTQTRNRWIRIPLCILFCVSLAGLAAEQFRIGYVYVFDKTPTWIPRAPEWAKPVVVKANYLGGFAPPLGPVSDWMLLNTIDGGSIFTSDIGQPLWYCTHLDLYDVDGLTDKYLAHAPSVRGDLETVEQRYKEILKQRNQAQANLKQGSDAMGEARRLDFDAHLTRNTEYILERNKPSYLLIFLQAESNSPPGKGYPYPEMSARVYNSPLREQDYEYFYRISKVANVFNTFFRRKEIASQTVSDEVKVERLRRTIQRNPRFTYLIPVTYQEMQKMQPGPARDAARQLVVSNIPKLAYNSSAVRELVSYASMAHDKELLDRLLDLSLRNSSEDPTLLRARAEGAWNQGNKEEGIEFMEKAAKYAPRGDNSYHYDLGYVDEATGQPDKAVANTRDAIPRNPNDLRQ